MFNVRYADLNHLIRFPMNMRFFLFEVKIIRLRELFGCTLGWGSFEIVFNDIQDLKLLSAHFLTLIGNPSLQIAENERAFKLQLKKLNQIKEEDCDKLEREKEAEIAKAAKDCSSK